MAQCGTHAIVDAVLGPVATGEQTLAAALITRLTPGMLVLADRNFYSYQAWQQPQRPGGRPYWLSYPPGSPLGAGWEGNE